MTLARIPTSASRHAGATFLTHYAAQPIPCGFRTRHSHAFTSRYVLNGRQIVPLCCIRLLCPANGAHLIQISHHLFFIYFFAAPPFGSAPLPTFLPLPLPNPPLQTHRPQGLVLAGWICLKPRSLIKAL